VIQKKKPWSPPQGGGFAGLATLILVGGDSKEKALVSAPRGAEGQGLSFVGVAGRNITVFAFTQQFIVCTRKASLYDILRIILLLAVDNSY